MTSIDDTVAQMLAQAESMRDELATRTLRGLRDDLADSTHGDTSGQPDDDESAAALVRRQIEERSRLASALAAQPDAAARLRVEAEVLTLVLTRSGR